MVTNKLAMVEAGVVRLSAGERYGTVGVKASSQLIVALICCHLLLLAGRKPDPPLSSCLGPITSAEIACIVGPSDFNKMALIPPSVDRASQGRPKSVIGLR